MTNSENVFELGTARKARKKKKGNSMNQAPPFCTLKRRLFTESEQNFPPARPLSLSLLSQLQHRYEAGFNAELFQEASSASLWMDLLGGGSVYKAVGGGGGVDVVRHTELSCQ